MLAWSGLHVSASKSKIARERELVQFQEHTAFCDVASCDTKQRCSGTRRLFDCVRLDVRSPPLTSAEILTGVSGAVELNIYKNQHPRLSSADQ